MIFHECKGEVEKDPLFFFKETNDNPQIQAYLNEKKEWLDEVRAFAQTPFSLGNEMVVVIAVMGSYHEWLNEKLAKKVTGEDLLAELAERAGAAQATGHHTVDATENSASVSSTVHPDSPFIPQMPSTPSPSLGVDSPFIPQGDVKQGLPDDISGYKLATPSEIPPELLSQLPPMIQTAISEGRATIMMKDVTDESA